ncbi:hypothetical protein ACGFX4_19925 [Kitasatospora sp. NPDC048365]|uniref:WXG100-like domain-containing protein n=1 Tax=Kitasatospora sp. NPDC048365 TaxID=3364050 RepID=UPI003718D71D
MAVQPPPGLDHVIALLGVRFPGADEDELRRLADQLEEFAEALDSAQAAADTALARLHEVYRGDSADKLAELWSTVTGYSRVTAETCHMAAKVLRAAAVVVELTKAQVITQLAVSQTQFAKASAAGSWRAAAALRVRRKILNQLLEAAAARFARTVVRPIEDMADQAAQTIPPTPAGGSGGQGFSIDLAQLAECAASLRGAADDIESHGAGLRRITQSLKAGEPQDPFGKLAIEATEKIRRAIAEDAVERILASFRDTAAKMDRLASNLNENEDISQAALNTGTAYSLLSPLQLRGGLSAPLNSPRVGGDPGLSAFDSLKPKLGSAGFYRWRSTGAFGLKGFLPRVLSGEAGLDEDTGPGATRSPELVRDQVRQLLNTDLTALGKLDEASLEEIVDTLDRGLVELLERLDQLPTPTSGALGDDLTDRPTGEHRG